MKLKKYVLLTLMTGSLALCPASPGLVTAEAAVPNSVAAVAAQTTNSYSLDFDASKTYRLVGPIVGKAFHDGLKLKG